MKGNVMSRSTAKAAAERLKNQGTEAAKAPEVKEGTATESSETNSSNSDDLSADTTSSNEKAEASTDVSNEALEEKEPAKLVKVEFVGPYKRYSKGDIASFSDDTAKELLNKKVAVLPGETVETELEPV
jgi:hypothetical protein